MRCGLLGEKLGHSYSPELHAFFGNYDYELFEVPPDQLGDFIRARDFQGLNVTIPYKTTMLAICDDLRGRRGHRQCEHRGQAAGRVSAGGQHRRGRV